MYAKRALARGDDPEEVIRRISDYRGDEKHSNYARYTVQKAQALGPVHPRTLGATNRHRIETRYESSAGWTGFFGCNVEEVTYEWG